MPDILLFGATGYTGKLTAHALHERGAEFAICGRNRDKLTQLAAETGDPEVRIAEAGDVDGLVRSLDGVKVLITCVGPFVELGATAVEAALRTGVHYIDSTGECRFVQQMIDEYDVRARSEGIALAPAMGFDEVPADVAATLASEGFDHAEVTLTYSLPSSGSRGTVKSALGILTSHGCWIVDGEPVGVSAGEHARWSPLPPPLGPRPTTSFPFAIGHLAPRHLDLHNFKTFVTTGGAQRIGLKVGLPALRLASALPGSRELLNRSVDLFQRAEGPTGRDRAKRWTVMAEGRGSDGWRNVVLSGSDVYGLTAELLASAALHMSGPSYEGRGVLAPVEAVGLDLLDKQLADAGVSTSTYGPT